MSRFVWSPRRDRMLRDLRSVNKLTTRELARALGCTTDEIKAREAALREADRSLAVAIAPPAPARSPAPVVARLPDPEPVPDAVAAPVPPATMPAHLAARSSAPVTMRPRRALIDLSSAPSSMEARAERWRVG